MSNKNLIQSMISNLQEFNSTLLNSGLDSFQSFVLGFVCGLDSDTDNIQQQIMIIKELSNKVNKPQLNDRRQQSNQKEGNQKDRVDEFEDSTPPLDDIDHKNEKETEQFTENSKNSSKGSVYLMSLQKKNNKDEQDKMVDSNRKVNGNQQSHLKNNKNENNRMENNENDFDVHDYMKQFQDQDEDEQKTLELIRQLQQEEEEQDRQMRVQDDEEIECPICMCELYTESVLALETCDHVFHKECLIEYLKNKIMDRKAQIVCPDEKCKTEILVDDFKQLLGKELYENYIQYSLQSYVDEHGDEMSWCPTPDCKYVFAYDENEDEGFFKCLMCKKQYCLKCRVAYHDGMSCKEYEITNKKDENDLKFEKFVKGKKFKQCIKCKFWVEKNHGCDHMTCRCKYEFCYKCGGKYRECECVEKFKQQQQRLIERRQARQQQKKVQKKVVGGKKPAAPRGRRGK